jgi:hypothetical protein
MLMKRLSLLRPPCWPRQAEHARGIGLVGDAGRALEGTCTLAEGELVGGSRQLGSWRNSRLASGQAWPRIAGGSWPRQAHNRTRTPPTSLRSPDPATIYQPPQPETMMFWVKLAPRLFKFTTSGEKAQSPVGRMAYEPGGRSAKM